MPRTSDEVTAEILDSTVGVLHRLTDMVEQISESAGSTMVLVKQQAEALGELDDIAALVVSFEQAQMEGKNVTDKARTFAKAVAEYRDLLMRS